MARREHTGYQKRREEDGTYREDASAREGKILVRICSRERGLEEFAHVKFVRVVSRRYNLLIMADYLPVIGELEGSVSFLAGNEEYERTHLKGFFMHKNNEFSLMLEKEGDGEA